MKKLIYTSLIFPVLMLIACQGTSTAMDRDLKTLRIVSLNEETKQLRYVPIRAIITGPGASDKPLTIDLGSQKLIQGMLTLKEDMQEAEKLNERARQKYGPDAKAVKDLTTDIESKVTCQQKPVWEHRILSGSRGLPFQVSLTANASSALDISMHFFPSGAKRHASTEIIKETRIQTRASSNIGSSATDLQTRSISRSANDDGFGKEFVIRQIIDF